MDVNFTNLIDVYYGFQAFRIGFQSLYKAHNNFINHIDSDCYAEWNDEAVEFCKGVLFTARCLGLIDEYNHDNFVCILNRYKSYNCR